MPRSLAASVFLAMMLTACSGDITSAVDAYQTPRSSTSHGFEEFPLDLYFEFTLCSGETVVIQGPGVLSSRSTYSNDRNHNTTRLIFGDLAGVATDGTQYRVTGTVISSSNQSFLDGSIAQGVTANLVLRNDGRTWFCATMEMAWWRPLTARGGWSRRLMAHRLSSLDANQTLAARAAHSNCTLHCETKPLTRTREGLSI
jgi:hypothetical protein